MNPGIWVQRPNSLSLHECVNRWPATSFTQLGLTQLLALFFSIEAMGKHSKLDIKILVDVFFQMSLIPPYPYLIILVFKEGHVHCQNLYKSPHPPLHLVASDTGSLPL